MDRPIAGPYVWHRARPAEGDDEDLLIHTVSGKRIARVYQGNDVGDAASEPRATARLLAASWDMFNALRVVDAEASVSPSAVQVVSRALNYAMEDWKSGEGLPPIEAVVTSCWGSSAPPVVPTPSSMPAPTPLSVLEREIIDAIVARRRHQRFGDDLAGIWSESPVTLIDRMINAQDAAAKAARAEQRAILLDIGTRLGTALRAAGATGLADDLAAFASTKLDEIAEPEAVTGRGIS